MFIQPHKVPQRRDVKQLYMYKSELVIRAYVNVTYVYLVYVVYVNITVDIPSYSFE